MKQRLEGVIAFDNFFLIITYPLILNCLLIDLVLNYTAMAVVTKVLYCSTIKFCDLNVDKLDYTTKQYNLSIK